MQFVFDEDQQLFQQTVRDFLEGECTPDTIRAQWESEAGHSPELWAKLAELGVPGLRVDEAHGGMGLDEIDAVLLFEEMGRAALAEPAVETAAVAAPLLAELGGELAETWLPRVAAGEALVAVSDAASPLVSDAHVAGLLLLSHGDEIHALDRGAVSLEAQPATDPSRRLQRVRFQASPATRVAEGERGRALQAAAFDRGALACAAQQLGVADRLIEMTCGYARQRVQFGVAIGSFQAVKHHLANVKVALEYARPAVHRAAHSVARGDAGRPVHVSMAKVAASSAAQRAAATALQVHGAIGYTWEQDLHIWMRRAGSLEQAFGRNDFHRRRVEGAVLAEGSVLGPGSTFAHA